MMTAHPDRAVVTDAIRRAADLLAIAQEATGQKMRRAGAEYRGPCPLHHGDNANFAVNRDEGLYFCHVCGKGGDVFDFVMEWQETDFKSARAFLAARVGIALDAPLPYRVPAAARPVPALKLDPNAVALAELRADGMQPETPADVYGAILDSLPLSADGATYLLSRGLDPDEARTYGFRSVDGPREWANLHDALAGAFVPAVLEAANLYRVRDDEHAATWAPPWGGYAPALVIPYKLKGEAVALRFRDMRPVPPKGKYRAVQPAGAALPPFNADALLDCAGRVLHVSEGELNAFAIMLDGGQAVGLPAAVWPSAWTPALAPAARVVVWFDADKHSDRQARSFSAQIQERFGSAWRDTRTRQVPLTLLRGDDGKNLDANDLHLRGDLRGLLARYATI